VVLTWASHRINNLIALSLSPSSIDEFDLQLKRLRIKQAMQNQEPTSYKFPTKWVLFAVILGVFFRWFRALEPAPFADSYHHWLVAARLVDVGGASHLFTHPDGAWPPLYSLFGAGLLWLFGTTTMAPLVWGSIACSALTIWLVAKLAAPREGDPYVYRSAPIIAAFLYALCSLDILTSSTPAMEPLAVLLVTLHWYICSRDEDKGASALLQMFAGLCLAAACLTRYEAWGVLAFSVFSWRHMGLRRVLRYFGPAALVCGLWLLGASVAALQDKLSPEAARHTGELYTLGALYGRFAVIVQTLFLATSPLLPAALMGLRRGSRLSAATRAFAAFLLAALVLGVISGGIAGSHRYISLALPVFAVSAARFWVLPSSRGALGVAGLLVSVFGVALAGYYVTQRYQADLGSFWFYLQPLPLLCLFLSALVAALSWWWLHQNASIAAVFIALALALSYLPIFAASELGRFVKPFQYAGMVLQQEQAQVLIIDNPIVGYFSGRPPKDLWMANRRKALEEHLPPGLLDQLEAHIANPSQVKAALVERGVTHIISEEVPYLFTRAALLKGLSYEEITAIYWTRAFILREVAVFRLR
jgi:hypothetical protein